MSDQLQYYPSVLKGITHMLNIIEKWWLFKFVLGTANWDSGGIIPPVLWFLIYGVFPWRKRRNSKHIISGADNWSSLTVTVLRLFIIYRLQKICLKKVRLSELMVFFYSFQRYWGKVNFSLYFVYKGGFK